MTQLTETGELQRWHRTLTYEAVRQLEQPHDATLPSGARLRGIALGNEVYLARDLKFYGPVPQHAEVQPMTYAEVVERLPFDALLANFQRVVRERLAALGARASRLKRYL